MDHDVVGFFHRNKEHQEMVPRQFLVQFFRHPVSSDAELGYLGLRRLYDISVNDLTMALQYFVRWFQVIDWLDRRYSYRDAMIYTQYDQVLQVIFEAIHNVETNENFNAQEKSAIINSRNIVVKIFALNNISEFLDLSQAKYADKFNLLFRKFFNNRAIEAREAHKSHEQKKQAAENANELTTLIEPVETSELPSVGQSSSGSAANFLSPASKSYFLGNHQQSVQARNLLMKKKTEPRQLSPFISNQDSVVRSKQYSHADDSVSNNSDTDLDNAEIIPESPMDRTISIESTDDEDVEVTIIATRKRSPPKPKRQLRSSSIQKVADTSPTRQLRSGGKIVASTPQPTKGPPKRRLFGSDDDMSSIAGERSKPSTSKATHDIPKRKNKRAASNLSGLSPPSSRRHVPRRR